MGALPANEGIEHAIAVLAARQHGVVTGLQLASIGIDRHLIARRLAAGHLHRLHRGVFAVGYVAPDRETRWMAAVLACGPGAVLSHRSAASLWAIRDGEGPRPDVSIATGNGRERRAGISVHRSRLHPQDCTTHCGIPVTTPTRTVVDLAHVDEIDDEGLAGALRQTRYQRRFNEQAAYELLTRRPSRALEALIEDPIVTQNRFEASLVRICDRHQIPRPLTSRQ